MPKAVTAPPTTRTAELLVRGASIHGGANSLYFDQPNRLYIASVGGREIVVMDPATGKILERLGPDKGVESPDDLFVAPDGFAGLEDK